jgi:hypothetical protein
MLSIEQNPKLGFYKVGEDIFYSKPEALLAATRTGQFPHWNFNRHVFSTQPWLEEPQTDLRTLYRMRAQQLREKYDYIRMEVSGGSDSTTALYAFLLNGIHIDEIIFRYPKQGEKGLEPNSKNTKPENTLSEWEFAAKPLLKWVATHFPTVKITFHDYSENIINYSGDESWTDSAKDYLHPEHVFKHDPLATAEQRALADTGKKICSLYGIDKPKICIRDGRWYFYFLDIQANHANTNTQGYTNITTEYFYWTPDLPEILRKQVHVIRAWFMRPENEHLQFLVRWPNYSVSQRTTYEALAKPLIYPDYDPTTWQVSKTTTNFYAEMGYWFYKNFQQADFYNTWQAGIASLVGRIDAKFFTYELGRPVGFVGFFDQFYDIGPATFENREQPRYPLI